MGDAKSLISHFHALLHVIFMVSITIQLPITILKHHIRHRCLTAAKHPQGESLTVQVPSTTCIWPVEMSSGSTIYGNGNLISERTDADLDPNLKNGIDAALAPRLIDIHFFDIGASLDQNVTCNISSNTYCSNVPIFSLALVSVLGFSSMPQFRTYAERRQLQRILRPLIEGS